MTIVVKIGGARAVEPEGALADIAHLTAGGERVVVVHGGSTAVDELLADLGREPEYVTTPGGVTGRFTDEETMEAFTMAMAGQVNTDLTTALRNEGVDALGLSGVDGGLLTGPRKSAVRVVEDGKKKIKRGDHSGKIESVNDGLLGTLLDSGYTPVVSVPMLADDGDVASPTQRGGGVHETPSKESREPTRTSSSGDGGAAVTPVNADADRAAAAVAGALGASLVVLTDVSGVYKDPDDPETLIEDVAIPSELERVESAAEGFMTKKVMAATEALSEGAREVIVSDANRDDPILAALDGHGTRFRPGAIEGEIEG